MKSFHSKCVFRANKALSCITAMSGKSTTALYEALTTTTHALELLRSTPSHFWVYANDSALKPLKSTLKATQRTLENEVGVEFLDDLATDMAMNIMQVLTVALTELLKHVAVHYPHIRTAVNFTINSRLTLQDVIAALYDEMTSTSTVFGDAFDSEVEEVVQEAVAARVPKPAGAWFADSVKPRDQRISTVNRLPACSQATVPSRPPPFWTRPPPPAQPQDIRSATRHSSLSYRDIVCPEDDTLRNRSLRLVDDWEGSDDGHEWWS